MIRVKEFGGRGDFKHFLHTYCHLKAAPNKFKEYLYFREKAQQTQNLFIEGLLVFLRVVPAHQHQKIHQLLLMDIKGGTNILFEANIFHFYHSSW